MATRQYFCRSLTTSHESFTKIAILFQASPVLLGPASPVLLGQASPVLLGLSAEPNTDWAQLERFVWAGNKTGLLSYFLGVRLKISRVGLKHAICELLGYFSPSQVLFPCRLSDWYS